jgi:microcystin-dependent protein
VPEGKPNEALGTIPRGGILLWTQASVPNGWAVCDGTQGTPDLRGLFVMGADADHAAGSTGGLARVTLTPDEMPSHTHEYVYPSGMDTGKKLEDNHKGHLWKNPTNATTSVTGGGGAHENRPPYYALYYIMRKFGDE